MYQIIKKVKCIDDKNKKFSLTIGKTYDILTCNSSIEDKKYLIFNDNGNATEYDKKYFKIVETINIENTGWKIECNDCCYSTTYKEILKNNNSCPICGQKFHK